jgi:hypothetical protein
MLTWDGPNEGPDEKKSQGVRTDSSDKTDDRAPAVSNDEFLEAIFGINFESAIVPIAGQFATVRDRTPMCKPRIDTNELLLIDKYRRAGHTEKELAKKMGWIRGWKKKVDEASQLLQLVKEIRKLAEPPLSYEIFDSKSQHLKDLNEEYNNMAQVDVEEANKMKWGRVAAMFLGVNKDQTRVIDPDFFEEDVLKRVAKNSKVIKILDSFKKVKVEDDLDELLGSSDNTQETLDLRSFAKKIIGDLSDTNGNVTKDLTAELQEIHNAIRLSPLGLAIETVVTGYLFSQPTHDLDAVDRLKNKLIAHGLCDAGATGGNARWMRLPVGINGKSKYGPEGFQCRLVRWAPSNKYPFA